MPRVQSLVANLQSGIYFEISEADCLVVIGGNLNYTKSNMTTIKAICLRQHIKVEVPPVKI